MRLLSSLALVTGVALLPAVAMTAVDANYRPVTQAMLLDPSPNDWLMFSRTYDAQRFSPLKQINKRNVAQLKLAWSKPTGTGLFESVPLVHDGVMYITPPGASVWALDATNGNLLWEYRRDTKAVGRSKSPAIYEDLVFFLAPDGYVVALDARSGKLRWETRTDGALTSGLLVVDGKVLTGRACGTKRDACYVSAHDARTGREAWRFYTTAGDDDPGGKSWGTVPENQRFASPWGVAGSYDPVRRLVYWGIANPMPNTRLARHGTLADIPRESPADLYSNSTVALAPDTGKLVWYYQHLPGDDWDLDFTHERTLVRTPIRPDPRFAKWFNPDIRPGEMRDVAVGAGEGGQIFVLDRATGQFLWATPFPYDAPNLGLASVDGKTGKTVINWDLVFKQPNGRQVICFHNTRNYSPLAYHPRLNALYVPYVDSCLAMTITSQPTAEGEGMRITERRDRMPRPGSDPAAYGGIAKVNLATGEIQHIYKSPTPGESSIVATAGDLLFWGDLAGAFRAFDAESGRVLWETNIGGPVESSTITYAVNGRQYVAVVRGQGLFMTPQLMQETGLKPNLDGELRVFALP